MSFVNYPYKKHTGHKWLGEIPTHWSLLKISQIFDFRNERVNDTDFIPLSVTKKGVVPQLENVAKTMHNDNRKKVLMGDIAINSRSDRRGSSGLSTLDGSCSVINHVLSPRIELEGKYMHYLFKSVPFCDEYYRWGTGIVSDLWSTQKERMGQIQVPFPTINEQKRIVDFLDTQSQTITQLKKKGEEQVQRLIDYRNSLITQAVTKGFNPNAEMEDSGSAWVGEVPKHWTIMKLGTASEKMTNGYVGPTRDIYVDEGTKYLQSLHVKKGTIVFERSPYYVTEEWSKKHANSILKEGDLVIVQTGAEVGQVAYISEEYEDCNCHALIIVRLKQDLLMGRYLAWYFQSIVGLDSLLLYKTGALHPHLDTGRIRNMKILLPPIEEQVEIINLLDYRVKIIEDTVSKVESQIKKLDEYHSSLISATVTGQIDVSEFSVSNDEMLESFYRGGSSWQSIVQKKH